MNRREARLEELASRIRELGMVPVWSTADAKFGQRLTSVLKCDAILLDNAWKTCTLCVDEYNIAVNHKKTIFHTVEEYNWILERYVI